MTTYQIVSDLHIEFKNNEYLNPISLIKPTADVLILAGDIGSLYKINQLFSFLRDCSYYFKHIIYVLGNHEFYGVSHKKNKSFTELLQSVKMLQCRLSTYDVSILQRTSIQIGKTLIAGCTLWSKIDEKKDDDDFDKLFHKIVRISDITQKSYNDLFLADFDFVQQAIQYCEVKQLELIMVTHHVPTFQCSEKEENIKHLYASNLENCLESRHIKAWVCGHTHKNFDKIIANTRVVSNQKGKGCDEADNFNPAFIL